MNNINSNLNPLPQTNNNKNTINLNINLPFHILQLLQLKALQQYNVQHEKSNICLDSVFI